MPQTFNHAVITNNGAALLNRAQAGEVKIEFTRIVVGNGIYADSEKELSVLQERTALKNQKNSYALSDIEVYTDQSVKVTALITNYDSVSNQTLVNQGYYINEMGLYARSSGSSEGPDILYSIAVISSETGDFMPPYNGYNPAEIIQEYYATVSSSANVTIQRNMGAPALADDLQDTNVRVDSLEKSRAWFCVCGSRKADVAKTVDLEGFRLFDGVRAAVYFTWGNTAENITLNINGTGTYPVKYKNAPLPAGFIQAEWAVEVAYHAGCWRVVGDLADRKAQELAERLDGMTPSDIGALSVSGNAASASKWNTARKINGMSIDGTADRTNYGVCSTSGSTAAKTVSCTGFNLVAGAEVTVKFNNTNTALNPTLNVNSTGAKAVYYKGAAVPSGYIASNGTYTFRYTGTRWEAVGDLCQEQVEALDSENVRLRADIQSLGTEIKGLNAVMSVLLEKIEFSSYNSMLWNYHGTESIRKEESSIPLSKCVFVYAESNAVYQVVTHKAGSTADRTHAMYEVMDGSVSGEYAATARPLNWTEGDNILAFRTNWQTKYLLINSIGSDSDIEVYKLNI